MGDSVWFGQNSSCLLWKFSKSQYYGPQAAFLISMSLAQSNSRPFESDSTDDLLAPPTNPTCWAAVSFAFEDAVWCDWIYREFDGTRVPRPLAGRPSRQGTPYPERISVSPDPSDPQQLENYAETLKAAQHLIIILSPGSANYHTMQEHLRLFRAAGGEERVIALIVKGEPASPSAEAGCAADAQWLPKWLQWRFQNNEFDPGPPCEPYVVDARLGISSLAEVRAKLCAALLEVPVTQLGELGVVGRSSTADFALHPKSPVIVSMPEPTPLPTLAEIAVPTEEPAPRPSRWPVAICAVAAVTAFGFLALWPAQDAAQAAPKNTPSINLKPQKGEDTPPASQVSTVQPLVAVVAVPEVKTEPVEQPAAVKAAPSVASAQPVVQNNPGQPVSVVNQPPPSKSLEPVAAAMPIDINSPSGTSGLAPAKGPAPKIESITSETPPPMTPEAEASERKRYELASRRDRLVRLAESKVNMGEVEEAIATFQQAVDTAHELVNRTDGGHDEVIELALLYRRFGNFAAGVNSSAEGRLYFERGRKALQALRVKGKLPREAFKILGDLEAAAKGRD